MKKGNLNPWIGLIGAAVGGIIGCVLFILIIRQGFYVLLLPGVMTGAGYSLFVQRRHVPCMVLCGVVAFIAGLMAEWRAAPFVADPSLGYFLTHVQNLRGLTLISLGVGAILAVWMARGRGTNRLLTEPHP